VLAETAVSLQFGDKNHHLPIAGTLDKSGSINLYSMNP
jgi:hypothetical protein